MTLQIREFPVKIGGRVVAFDHPLFSKWSKLGGSNATISPDVFLDGKISVDEESQSVKDRKNLSFNGFLEITIIVNNIGTLVKKPIISFRGIPSNEEGGNFVFELENKIRDICKTFSLKNSNQEQNLIEALKTNCRKTVKEKTGKRPYTNVNLVRI